MTRAFKVGDTVEWTSQAGGFTKTKRGVVREVVPPKGRMSSGMARGLSSIGSKRDHESYIVQVTTGAKGGVSTYWPRVSALRAATPTPRA